MKHIKSFSILENDTFRNSDEILTIGEKKIDITKLNKKQQQDIYNLISEFDTTMSREELSETVELYILSIS